MDGRGFDSRRLHHYKPFIINNLDRTRESVPRPPPAILFCRQNNLWGPLPSGSFDSLVGWQGKVLKVQDPARNLHIYFAAGDSSSSLVASQARFRGRYSNREKRIP